MGLDMYLTARKYLREDYDQEKREYVPSAAQKALAAVPGLANFGTNFNGVSVEVAYWRKENAIHKYFVDNVQNGKDECQESYVEEDDLRDLYDKVCRVLNDNKLAEGLLPTQSGFFFGSTEYDEWYFKGLEDTKEVLEKIFAGIEADKKASGNNWCSFDFYYRASW